MIPSWRCRNNPPRFPWISGYRVARSGCRRQSRCIPRVTHESAYLLAKGRPKVSDDPLAEVQPWEYTGNLVHSAEKAVSVMEALTPRRFMLALALRLMQRSQVDYYARTRAFLVIRK
jgi:hypothetical protein